MDCSFLINTSYVTGKYQDAQMEIDLEAKSNACIVEIKRKCKPCNPCHLCDPCNPCKPCHAGLPNRMCHNCTQCPLEIKLDRSCSVVDLPCLNYICEIYPMKCELNWYLLQGKQYLEIEYQYKLLYYNQTGQEMCFTDFITQNFKGIDRKLDCDYRLRIDNCMSQIMPNYRVKLGIEAVLEVWPKCKC